MKVKYFTTVKHRIREPFGVELEKPVGKNELLKHEENEKFSEGAADAAELCIAASEALVIDDVIGNDSFENPSASATHEASLRVKQARLDVWRNIISDIDDEISESHDLSDLDNITIERFYEDAGILFNEFSSCELSTMSHDRELEKGLMPECIDGDVQNKVTGNPEFGLDTDVGYDNDCSKHVEAQEKFGLSVTE
ncbi:hypothetical protein BUALT_Bualt01G0153100 [Buddleja alternifolia]|uniref:Uncharacterized protein n=1 Tax=Buddleja alternifolia TaxID=168488 RepID=A0AAV6Y8C9_9LAMI|nr:hypothetical protein BUALT_Bualt01G0153100 [Buddleja alternifolia]